MRYRHKRGPELRAVASAAPVAPPQPPPAPPAATLGAGMTVELVDVSPEQATAWLERNHPSNRPISWGQVEAFTNDMRAGQWKVTHQAVCFDGEGYLIDGQHRLNAVAQAGVPVRMLVVRNAAGSFHDPIDRGRTRSVATIMGLSTRETGALNILRMLEVGYAVHTPMTLAEAELVAGRHREAIQRLSRVPLRGKLSGATQAACVWSMPVDAVRTEEFATRAASGEMIGRGDAAYAWRAWRERNRRADTWDVALATLNCLRHHLTGTSLSAVFTGDSGYRAFCGRRRAMRVPHTPTADLVPAVGWAPSTKSGDGEEPRE